MFLSNFDQNFASPKNFFSRKFTLSKIHPKSHRWRQCHVPAYAFDFEMAQKSNHFCLEFNFSKKVRMSNEIEKIVAKQSKRIML